MTPSLDTTSHEAAFTSDNTPTMIALIMPESGWYGQVSAVVHAYSTSDKTVCASFVVRGVAKRVSGTATVQLSGMYDFDSSVDLQEITAEFAPATYASESHVLLMATGHATIGLEWHVHTTTMYEAA